jgi:sigma-B regulation protein RsbU (phosphoserine phosphatase)
MSKQRNSSRREMNEDLGRRVFNDLRHTSQHDYLAEIKGLYHFYLDDERRAKLDDMGRFKRAFLLLGWILKSLLLNLSPPRRMMLLISLVLVWVLGPTSFTFRESVISADFRPWGYLLILLVLMLELKDKLVAKDEINTARQVQLALLPRTHPDIPGWAVWSYSRPANDVGGDLFDYIELDGFRHGLLLGDVAGKGLGAALLTAKLQATIRALVPNALSLEELASQMNSILHRDGLDNRYATMFYSEVEHNSGQVRYLNAGHNPALVVHEDRIDKLESSSFPVGMMAETKYKEGAFSMAPGEMLFVYTDGLSEAMNSAGEEFGTERVEDLARDLLGMDPDAAGKHALKAINRFLGDARPDDDLSLMILVRQEQS